MVYALAVLVVLIVSALAALLFGFPIKWLWNAVVPEIFGLPTITYWQAVGLNMLSALLLRSYGAKGGGS